MCWLLPHPTSQGAAPALSSPGGLHLPEGAPSPARPDGSKRRDNLFAPTPHPQTLRSSRAAGFYLFSKHVRGSHSFPALFKIFRKIKSSKLCMNPDRCPPHPTTHPTTQTGGVEAPGTPLLPASGRSGSGRWEGCPWQMGEPASPAPCKISDSGSSLTHPSFGLSPLHLPPQSRNPGVILAMFLSLHPI